MSRDWDAATYDRVSAPQVAWADAVLDRLALRGDERVLDAGCGSGRVTRMLVERLPDGEVVAVDQSESMVEAARAALPGVRVIHAELTALELEEPVDAVFSNAVFHWVPDHEALFARMHAALRPGGRLVAQCGGRGNVAAFHDAANAVGEEEPYARHLAGWVGPWNFAGPEETEERLLRAGFEEVACSLRPWPVVPPDPTGYLRTVCLGYHLERLPEDLRAPYVEAVAARVSELDYVRLDIDARRPA
ncbi:MAG TPA: methyltransferase domain-containing protein [Thermoleophilaceae bacterium]|nr:methyltransferase domain-containing protein [Thermoleophilaceae bacterium]